MSHNIISIFTNQSLTDDDAATKIVEEKNQIHKNREKVTTVPKPCSLIASKTS